jgi:hypothetical protein
VIFIGPWCFFVESLFAGEKTLVMKLRITTGTIVPKIFALFAALVLFVTISASQVYGQARPSPMENVISIDPLPLAYDGSLVLQYEYKNGPVESWLFRLHYWPDPSTLSGWSGFGAGAAYRFYVADSRALTGLSVAPAADIFFFRQPTLNYSSICADIGGDIAYKYIFDDFAIEPLLGLRIGFALSGVTSPTRATGLEGLIGFAVGYAF